MGEIIARFADGRLLVQEDRAVETDAYTSGYGVPVRIGHVRTVEKVLSVGAHMSGYPADGQVQTPLREASISGDTVHVVMRRIDLPLYTSGFRSGLHGFGMLSGVTSGVLYLEELGSGRPLSGKMQVTANVIGF